MSEETYDPPRSGWCCFHCGEHFKVTEQDQARDHFGPTPDWKPKCFDRNLEKEELVIRLRHAETEVARYREVASDAIENEETANGSVRAYHSYFPGTHSAYEVWQQLHSMEGRALAAEATLKCLEDGVVPKEAVAHARAKAAGEPDKVDLYLGRPTRQSLEFASKEPSATFEMASAWFGTKRTESS